MAIIRRGKTWYIDITAPNGQRIRRSTGTVNRKEAQEYHDTVKAELWRTSKLGEKPSRSWREAVVRWLKEIKHLSSYDNYVMHLKWIDKHFNKLMLVDITRDVIDDITNKRLTEGVSNATVNRLLEVIRAILRKACNEWEWLDRVPKIRMLNEPKKRIRWITKDEARSLISELPHHLKPIVRFSLATGLRKRNVLDLEWSQVDLDRQVAWIHADQTKAKKAIAVPLNKDALTVLNECHGVHEKFIFTYRGSRLGDSNTKAWKSALARAGIENFRWHDLRHTWASWPVQNNTPLSVLQELGSWESPEMVRRYAHLSPEHLLPYAQSIELGSV